MACINSYMSPDADEIQAAHSNLLISLEQLAVLPTPRASQQDTLRGVPCQNMLPDPFSTARLLSEVLVKCRMPYTLQSYGRSHKPHVPLVTPLLAERCQVCLGRFWTILLHRSPAVTGEHSRRIRGTFLANYGVHYWSAGSHRNDQPICTPDVPR